MLTLLGEIVLTSRRTRQRMDFCDRRDRYYVEHMDLMSKMMLGVCRSLGVDVRNLELPLAPVFEEQLSIETFADPAAPEEVEEQEPLENL